MPVRSQPLEANAGDRTGARLGHRILERLRQSGRSTVISIAVVAYFFASGVTWAMTTPIGGVPDEPSHITYSAGVIRGDLGALRVVNHPNYPQLAVVTVPAWVGTITSPARSVEEFSYPCYATVLDRTGDCAPTLSRSTQLTPIPTTVTRYPPAYYWVVGLPTLVMAGEPAVHAMRVISAALAAAMIAMGLAIAAPSRRTWLALGAMVAFTPMVAQYAGSVNPSGLETSAALGLGIGIMGITGTEHRNDRLDASFLAVLAFALAWARPSSYLVLVAVIAAGIVINATELRMWLRRSSVRYFALFAIAVAGISAAIYQKLFTGLTPLLTGPAAAIRNEAGAVVGLEANLHALERRFSDFGMHFIGRFGWLDHSAPRSVWVFWILISLALVVLAIGLGRRRDRTALLVISVGSLVLAPLFIMSSVISATEYQARYHLSVAVLIVVAATAVLLRLPRNQGRRTAWSILSVAARWVPLAMLVSIAASLHRNSLGGEAQLIDVLKLPFGAHRWLPGSGAMLVAGLGVLTAATAVFAISRLIKDGVD